MAIKTVTFFYTLIQLAKAMAEAEKNGSPEEIVEARRKHDEYKQLCLDSDEMCLGIPKGKL